MCSPVRVGFRGGDQLGAVAAWASAAEDKGEKGSKPSICISVCHGIACSYTTRSGSLADQYSISSHVQRRKEGTTPSHSLGLVCPCIA